MQISRLELSESVNSTRVIKKQDLIFEGGNIVSRPVVREYQNDEKLKSDIEELSNIGVSKDDIYVLSHDDDRTERVADGVDANTIGKKEMGLSSLKNVFSKKGDELRSKMQEIGFSKEESERYEDEMDKGKIFMFVTDTDKVTEWK